MARNKLELTWVGKEDRPRLEPRILLEDPEKSYHAKRRVIENDIFDNRLIFGDNLLALKALEAEFTGRVKCVFIDPPYNRGVDFEQYEDGLEHSQWLSMMRDRLELLARLLSRDGSIWITIDDSEAHYLKVLCDEVFGRSAFIANITWQKRVSRENRAAIGSSHDHVLVYAPIGKEAWRGIRNKLPRQASNASNPDGDARGPWESIPFTAQGFRANQMYVITTPTGKRLTPPKGRCWAATEPEYIRLRDEEKKIYFPKGGNGRPRVKQFPEDAEGLVPSTWWPASEVGDNEDAKKESLELFLDQPAFGTPKPEALIERIVAIGSRQGEIVLDSFAGSGTTGAVAHKMGRRWIMVELGDHCHTHIIPRLKKVIDGEDPGGVTEGIGWKGGGGFRYYRLAPSLLEKDKYGNWVISKEYNAAMLAEAVAKLCGFSYAPSETVYWQHGRSTEHDFIYVTTQTLTRDQLQSLSDEVGEGRTLLICCSAFHGKKDAFKNLTLRKIPAAVIQRCEWGRDDYSLAVAALPEAEVAKAEVVKPTGRSSGKAASLPLFDDTDDEGGKK